MRELIWEEENIRITKDQMHILGYDERVVRQHDRIFEYNFGEKYVHATSFLKTGMSAYRPIYGRHRWWRWSTDNMISLSKTKKGQWFLRRKAGKKFYSDSPYDWEAICNPTNFNRLGSFVYPRLTINDIYPITEHWGIADFRGIPQGFPALKETSTTEFIYRVFGKRAYRKDLVKAAMSVDEVNLVNIAAQFRPYVPVDWLVTFLRNNQKFNVQWMEMERKAFNATHLKVLLTKMSQRSMRNLMFSEFNETHYRELADVMSNVVRDNWRLPNFNGEGIRNWHEVHERFYQNRRINHHGIPGVAPAYRIVPPTINMEEEIPVLPVGQRIVEQSTDNFKFVLPSTVGDLFHWSDYMNNCISSYRNEVTKKYAQVILGGVYVDGKLVANFELALESHFDRWTLRQLLGKHNQVLPDEIRKPIEMKLRTANVFIGDHYWGMPQVTLADAPW